MKQNARALALAFVIFAALCWQPTATFTFAQQPAPQQTPVEVKIDGKIFDRYVGQYEDAANLGGLIFSFFREGDKFYLQATNQDKIEIFPASEIKFFTKAFPAEAEFVKDATGRVTAMIWRQGREFTTKRIADQPAKDARVAFKRTEARIPMRDGTKLFTVIFTPENQTEPLPILLNRTPYGVKGWSSNGINISRAELVKDGYIFVMQDIRGRSESEGEFVMLRPPREDRRDAKSVDESTDTYDTIEYLIKNVPQNNGRVGIYGVSYDGWLSAVALLDQHPALKASSPQAPVTDLWMGDDFFHHGAFRQTYAHEWAVPLETIKGDGDVRLDKPDAFDWYFDLKTPANLISKLGGKSASWNNFLAHPAWDEFWQARAANLYLKEANVPTLIVGGWWDQEDLYGPLALYEALEKTDRDNQVFLVMGPWNHGGWGVRGRRLGAIDFGSDTGRHFRSEMQAPFFAFHLKGKGDLKQPEAAIFQSGSNRWMAYDAWTPRNPNLQKRNLYLHAEGKLSFEKPTAKGEEFQSYISDPANPIPYRKRPILATYGQGSTWSAWLVDDQRFLADRKDVLRWQSDVLTEDLTITGDIIANLFAATSGSDSDWVIKLIDVYPAEYAADAKMAGYQLMVASEIFRGRYRKSFERAAAIEPNKPAEYKIDLRGNDYVFKKGHRLMVQVQSTWFPLYDRNPQKFVENIFAAKESDYQTATQRIYFSPKHSSHIAVSVAAR